MENKDVINNGLKKDLNNGMQKLRPDSVFRFNFKLNISIRSSCTLTVNIKERPKPRFT